MSKVKVGLVGLGQRGLQHLNSLWQITDAEVVALCDPAPDNLAAEKIQRYVDGFSMGDIRTYDNFAAFFAAGGCDAIYFAIPPSLHAGEILQAAEKGIHLFVEKPVSLYLDEALEMQRAIDKAGIISTVGFNQRHDNWHDGVRDFLADKRLVMMTYVVNGTLESHSVKHTHTEAVGGPKNRVWAANRSWSGGTIVEAGIHQTDLMRFWAGDIDWAEARGGATWVPVHIGAVQITVTDREFADMELGRYQGYDHFALTTDDFDATLADIERLGVSIWMGPVELENGMRIIFIDGPDHIKIELMENV